MSLLLAPPTVGDALLGAIAARLYILYSVFCTVRSSQYTEVSSKNFQNYCLPFLLAICY
jgi:hypothetical protein